MVNGLKELYTFEQALAMTPGNGWLTHDEARLLWDTAKDSAGDILEIGSYLGKSTILLACLGRQVHAVDPFSNFDTLDMVGDNIYERLVTNLHNRNLHDVIIYRQKIEDWLPVKVGFAYLDGDHTYEGTMSQIKVAKAAGAMTMCLHDYENAGGGREVVRAVSDSGILVLEIVERMARCHRGIGG